MNRTDVFSTYEVNPDTGVIQSPGKFENEMLYVPALWAHACEGGADFDENGVYGYVFNDSDHEEFPEIGTAFAIMLEESDTGFVNTREFETVAEWDAACELINAQAAAAEAEYYEEEPCNAGFDTSEKEESNG